MRYAVTTGLTPREALEQAAACFGPGGVGLHAVTQTPHSLVCQGGGGQVATTVHLGTPTTLELETREWDGAVHTFMGQVSQRPRHPQCSPSSTMRRRSGPLKRVCWGRRSTGTRHRRKPSITVGTLLMPLRCSRCY